MLEDPKPPIRLVVERQGGSVEVALIGEPGSSDRYIYALDITGASRSHHAATYVDGRASKVINRTRFPDRSPWRIEFKVRDASGHIVHEEALSDHG